MPDVVTTPETATAPDVPAGQSITGAVKQAVAGVEDAATHPSLATAGAAVSDISDVLDNPTALALERDLPPLIKESKAGWKTTEFWAGIAAALNDVISTLPPTDKVALTGLAAVYAVARGIAKNGIPFVSSPVAPE